MRPLYRNALPQLDGRLYLTDGGIETTLIFHQGIELPDFAAFDLLRWKAPPGARAPTGACAWATRHATSRR